MSTLRFAILLGMTVAIGAFALDTYLPAFPDIAADLGVDLPAVGRTLSVYVFVLGLAQLVGGPLSDRYGRRVVLFSGLGIFAVASVMVALSESLGAMMFWRMVQATGGACCAVSVPAIVRDRTHGQASASLFSLIGIVMLVAPALAPAIGSLLLYQFSWPAIFVFLAAYAVVVAVTLQRFLFRNLPAAAKIRTPAYTLVTNYIQVVSHGTTMRFIAIQTLAFSVMLVFITHASFIYQGWFGVSNGAFSLLFAANVVAMVTANLLNRRLLKSFHSTQILRAGCVIQAVAVLLLVVTLTSEGGLLPVALCLVVTGGCLGVIIPNNIANALEFFPKLGGTASAMLGASQFALGGLISALSTVLVGATPLPVAFVMAACTLSALGFALGAPRAMRNALDLQSRGRETIGRG
ncbi:multidrug effflux MFS transporter [Wenzhouxiangella sp. XN201]|uniref:Bcr/CflA family efflux MFS transporter n=1 Tax=Wenzhouxiangella sp. XN201 TaxID=2710755 RepID=UPI0013C7F059|nr:multidrug effflux MFS transporter [Wenzhouxiangella sp. XN201]